VSELQVEQVTHLAEVLEKHIVQFQKFDSLTQQKEAARNKKLSSTLRQKLARKKAFEKKKNQEMAQ